MLNLTIKYFNMCANLLLLLFSMHDVVVIISVLQASVKAHKMSDFQSATMPQ